MATKNPADAIKYYVMLIVAEQQKIQDALAAISEYSAQLQRVTDDTGRRLLTRE
jgi:hypothetical protein